jgi:hypothetical protein
VTLEGSYDGNAWVDLLTGIPTIQDTTGVTIDSGGMHLTAARAQAGVNVPIDVAYPRIRAGLAGDNAAPGGTGYIAWRPSR